jgi:hypothetical protein
MSPAPAAARLLEGSPAEHRSHQRYPIKLEVEYRVLKKGRVERGFGRTLNISSGGVFFETKSSVPPNGPIELLLNWPFLLEGTCPLKLVMRGRIVRTDGKGVAIKFKHHEFRTAGARRTKVQSSSQHKVRSLIR